MARPKPLVAGNWKMNGLIADLAQIEALKSGLPQPLVVDVMLCLPATLLTAGGGAASGSAVAIGAQDCHGAASGAFTGDISAPMLKDAGASAVILGHSERRSLHGETNRLVRAKGTAALNAGLSIIVCVGETAGERAAGLAASVCLRQLRESLPDASSPANTIIAYEPVWAIGTGVVPTSEQISEIHALLRGLLQERFGAEAACRILYGGSVTPANAESIFENKEVDGALVGGASLKAVSFLAIVAAANRAAQPHTI